MHSTIVRIAFAAACILLTAGGSWAEKLVNDRTGVEMDVRVVGESPQAFYVAASGGEVRSLPRPPWRRIADPPTSRPAPPPEPAEPAPASQPASQPAGPTADELAEQLRRLAELDVRVSDLLARHEGQLAETQRQLADARETMTEKHPTVIRLREELAKLQAGPPAEAEALRQERAKLLAPFEPIWRKRIELLEAADRARAELYKPADPGRVALAAQIAELKAILAGPVPEQARGGYMNLPEAAVRVVFVVDRSGSMFDTFDYVRAWIKTEISRLKPHQRFHVVFFGGGRPEENPPKALVPATEAYKRQAYDFLSGVVAEGWSDPEPALRRAFAVKDAQGRPADAIYLLSDGSFERRAPGGKETPDIAKALAALQAHASAKVRVHTVGFVYRTGEEVLKRIAEENDGTYTFIGRDDLGR